MVAPDPAAVEVDNWILVAVTVLEGATVLGKTVDADIVEVGVIVKGLEEGRALLVGEGKVEKWSQSLKLR